MVLRSSMLRRLACVGALIVSSTVAGCAFDPSMLFPYGDDGWTDGTRREPRRTYRYVEARPVRQGSFRWTGRDHWHYGGHSGSHHRWRR